MKAKIKVMVGEIFCSSYVFRANKAAEMLQCTQKVSRVFSLGIAVCEVRDQNMKDVCSYTEPILGLLFVPRQRSISELTLH